MRQLVTKPTRLNNILDLVMVDDDRTVYNIAVIEHFGSSDHCMVTFEINCKDVSPILQISKNTVITDFKKLRDSLSLVNWDLIFRDHLGNTEALWESFINVLNDTTKNTSTVLKHSNGVRVKKPKVLQALLLRKRKLWRIFKERGDNDSKLRYNECRAKYSNLVKKLEIKKEMKVISEGNLAALYRFIKTKTGSQRNFPPLIVKEKMFTTDYEKASILNTTFVEHFVVDNGIIPPLNYLPAQIDMPTITFSPQTVLLAMDSFKKSKAVGPDGFSAYYYNEIKYQISKPLSFIFSASYTAGALPSCWKTSRIVPIFKKGDAGNPSNYRPIALTAFPCRIMEKIIKSHMTNFIAENNILSCDQFGFIKGRSTTLLLLKLLNDWTMAMDDGIPTDVVFIDFSKAFDSVVHNKLFLKLHEYGFDAKLLSWLKSFVMDRRQYVTVGNSVSTMACVLSGVPQGSVLGPLLFILYLNDLSVSAANLDKFADDVEMHSMVVDDTTYQSFSSSLYELMDWSNRWQLEVASEKCNVMHIGKANLNYDYSLPHGNLSTLDNIRHLGVIFSKNLKFSQHCTEITKKAQQRLAIIRRCFCSKNKTILLWAYKVYVRPILEYASQVWSPYLLDDIDRIERVQRRFTKCLPGLHSKSYAERLNDLSLDSLELRRLKNDLSLTFSILNGLVDIDQTSFFTLRNDQRTRGHSLKLVVEKFNTDCRKCFFSNRVVKAWNSLPDSVVRASSLLSFKKHLTNLNLTNFLRRDYSGTS